MTETDKNNIDKGTISEFREDSTDNLKALKKTVSLKDLALIVGGVLLLHLIGLIKSHYLEL